MQHDIAKGGGKEALERHWDSWITEEDWKWIVDKGFNTVRLPVSSSPVDHKSEGSLTSEILLHQIGYYHLSSPNACPTCLKKTDFESFTHIYEGAWPRIAKAIEDAGRWGLGILIDLHGVSGNQNDDGTHCSICLCFARRPIETSHCSSFGYLVREDATVGFQEEPRVHSPSFTFPHAIPGSYSTCCGPAVDERA